MPSTSGNSSVNSDTKKDELTTCKLKINGDLSGHRVKQLEDEFFEALSAIAYKKVVLDISEAHNMDSPGLALCVGLFKECQKKNFDFEIIVNSDICNIFKLVNLYKILPIKEIN